MRAYRLSGPGLEGIQQVDLPEPTPGRRQVLVKVAACSLNYRDLAIALGQYRQPTRPNLIPLSDGAGEVVAVGADVTRVKPGDRVAGCFFQRWSGGEAGPEVQATALGGTADGMLAEHVVLEDEGVVKVPDHLSYEEAATLPCAGLTAWHALVVHGQLIAGRTILAQGTGGVSIFALQFARLFGANAIVTSSSDDKLARAQRLGAAQMINYKTKPEWDQVARELTGGRGVDQVVEVGGAGTFARSLEAIRVGGKISLIGVLSGANHTINPMAILARRANVQGISVGSTQMFEAMNAAIGACGLKPVVDRVFPFAEAAAAYRHLQSGSHFGKVVISLR
jgi:NADPH:quinone reductase-like Zn-dependent oxidoreductase